MTHRLILIRHAKSSWDTPGDDHARPLNARGRAQAPAIGKWLASRGDIPGQVLCSDAERTKETLALILPELGGSPKVQYLASLYHAPPATMLAALRKATEKVVLMVGHNPGIAAFAEQLAYQPPVHPRFLDYPTGATTVFDFTIDSWDEAQPGLGALRDFVTPDEF